jgi:hypothetical protein
MMDARMDEVLERTGKTLCRHLEDLNDEVENDGGRIKDHMVLDGFKDALKCLWYMSKIVSGDDADNGPAEMPDSVRKASPLK